MIIPITKNSIKTAKDYLLNGKPIIYPTDTLYSFGAIATDTKTITLINKLKKRESPLSIILSSINEIEKYGYIQDKFLNLINKIFPGKYTILIKAKKHNLSTSIQNKSNLIGIRVPNENFCIELVKSLRKPIITTSVNVHGAPALLDVDNMQKNYPKINIFCSERKLNSKGSTILDLSKDSVDVVRLGDEEIF